MATQGQGQQIQQPQGQGQPQGKESLAPVLQQLNLASLRTRTQDLHNAIGRILQAFHTNPSLKWSEVLGQFAMVNLELLNLIDDVKPILKMFVVYPKTVNAENAPILPIMLSSKLLPEMEAEEAILKEKILSNLSGYNMTAQSENLQRQIEAVRSACDIAEKVITEARKVYGLGIRQGPVALATMDKLNVARIAEQEKLLRVAHNYGEGLRSSSSDQQQQASALPPHLASVLPTPGDGRSSFPDGGFVKSSAAPVLPPTGLVRSAATPQQSSVPQVTARVQTPSQPIAAGVAAASPSPAPFVNSPRSSGTNFNVPSPQQQAQQASQQLAYLQKVRTQQQLQRQQQQQQQQAHLQQQQQQQQQQQLRRPATPPIPQVGGQPQAQVAQPLLHQQQQQKLQHLQQQNHLQQLQQHQAHQQQAQLQQQLQAQQDRHSLQHLQAQQQQQQQNLQQLQTASPMMTSNTLQQGNQVRPQMGQLANPMTSLYGGGTNTLLTSNMFQQGNMSTNQISANQPQRNVSSQMLTDSLYIGTGTQMAQGTSTLGLPMQQQLGNQPNYMNMFNSATQSNFGQNRQQPPPS